MSPTVEKYKADLMQLGEEEREELLPFLADSLNGEPVEIDPELAATLRRRVEELRSGKVKGIPGEEVMERMRKKFQ